jgi:hypothetical protein
MDKLNAQPEPPAPWDVFGWFAYLFEWIVWGLREILGIDSPISG